MRRLALALIAPIAATPALAGEPVIFGQRFTTPLFSPPGYYGPGPAGHRGSPQYTDWNYYGLTGGPTISPGYAGRGHGFGPGYFGIPGAAGSFWTNGFSLYGPPIPTYAPVPGTFGGADLSRAYFDAPPLPAYGAAVGVAFPGKRHPLQPPLGWLGQYSPSPRHLVPTVSVYAQGVAIVPGPPAVTPAGEPCVRVAVIVPDPGAKVWIQHAAMASTGTEREFVSPPLEAGKEYEYELIARWNDTGGRERAETRQVRLVAGQSARVSFGEAAGADPERGASAPRVDPE